MKRVEGSNRTSASASASAATQHTNTNTNTIDANANANSAAVATGTSIRRAPSIELEHFNDDDVDADADSDSDADSDATSDSDFGSDDDSDSDDSDDDDVFDEEQLEGLLQLGIRYDEHAHRLFRLGTYLSASAVLLSSLRVAKAIDGIQIAVQDAGVACIAGITQSTVAARASSSNNNNNNNNNNNINGVDTINDNYEMESCCVPSETKIEVEWKNRVERIKVASTYCWYRMYHATLSPSTTIKLEHC